jgi:hypothetical protein
LWNTGKKRVGILGQRHWVIEDCGKRRKEMYRLLKFTNSSAAQIAFERGNCLNYIHLMSAFL